VGTDIAALARRGAHYVDRLLDGAKPSELPIERPTIYKLSINRATSAKLGLAVPQALLLRADEVIR
jgi:putative ABC transport system substrate-binding protein